MPEEQHHHVNGHLAMLAVVVGPFPREQQQRDRHLDRGDDHQRTKYTAHERPGARNGAGRRQGCRCLSGMAPASEDTGDDVQVLKFLAVGRRGEFRASIPLDVVVQRERVRHIGYEIVTIFVAHYSSGFASLCCSTSALAQDPLQLDSPGVDSLSCSTSYDV